MTSKRPALLNSVTKATKTGQYGHVVCLILRDSPFLFLLSIFSPIVFFVYLVLQLLLPRCGGQIPCALSLMRTLAPLPSTTLSQMDVESQKLEHSKGTHSSPSSRTSTALKMWTGLEKSLPVTLTGTNFGVILSPHSIREMKDIIQGQEWMHMEESAWICCHREWREGH